MFKEAAMFAKGMTVQEFFKTFPDDDACLEHLMRLRYGETLDCPKCGKRGRFAKLSKVPAYSCPSCGHHIHPMAGTIFAKSHTPLQKWFYALYLFTTSRHGVPAKELERQLGVSYPTAWRIGHEIRKFMAEVDGDAPLAGHVEIDETYLGGQVRGKGRGLKMENKSIILGMVARGGDLITKVVERATIANVMPHIRQHVPAGSEISTDENSIYRTLYLRGYRHGRVNHALGEYVVGSVHTNSIENVWSQFKRSIRGTHVHVSRKHLSKYLGEFEFRFNMRKQAALMFPRLLLSF